MALHVPISLLWWFWSVGFDGTHIFATASRTFFDREARARQSKLLYGSLIFFFALGPAMVLAGLKGWLYLLVGVWAYYHVMRQHYGFMVLYKVKNRDLAPFDNTLDRVFLGVMLVAPPFQRFFLQHPKNWGFPSRFRLWRFRCRAWWPRHWRCMWCANGSDGAPAAAPMCRSTCCSPLSCRCTGSPSRT